MAAAVVVVGAIPRILLAAGALPEGLRPFIWSDVLYTWQRANGGVPYWSAYFEYPPLTGYLAGLLTLAAGSAVAYVSLWAALQGALAALIAWMIARESGPRSALVWSASPQLLLFGSLNFDLLAIAGLVAAIAYGRRRYAVATGLSIAAGAAAKLFPIALLPVIVVHAWPRKAVAAVVACGLLLVALYLPAAAAPYSDLESVTRYAAGIKPNFDSVFGYLAGLLRGGGVADPSRAVLILSTGGLLITYVLAVIPASRSARDVAVPAALAVLTLLLWTRLYSPQYSLWAVPLFALLALPRGTFALLSTADVLVFLTVFPLTMVAWTKTDTEPLILFAALTAGIALRHAALIAAFVSAWRMARPRSATTP